MNAITTFVNELPSGAWIVLGALIAFIGVAISNHQNLKRLKMQLQHERDMRDEAAALERLEELYELINAARKPLDRDCKKWLEYIEYGVGSVDPNGVEGVVGLGRIGMMIHMYEPSLREYIEKAVAKYGKCAVVVNGFLAEMAGGVALNREYHSVAMKNTIKEMDESFKEVLDEICASAHRRCDS
jgi:hypothetical protein